MDSLQQVAPSITKKPTLTQENNGNTLIIRCEIEAFPKPEIVWFKGNFALSASDKIINEIDYVDNIYHVCLKISDITSDDSGIYKLTAKNSLGDISALISVNFACKIVLFKKLKNIWDLDD